MIEVLGVHNEVLILSALASTLAFGTCLVPPRCWLVTTVCLSLLTANVLSLLVFMPSTGRMGTCLSVAWLVSFGAIFTLAIGVLIDSWGGGGWGGGGGGPPDDPRWDWDTFDRKRAGWSRPRDVAGTR